MGKPVDPVEGQNHKEVIAVWLSELQNSIDGIEQRGGMANPQELIGLKNLSMHIKVQIAMVAQDENEKQYVKEQMDIVGNLDNYLKAYEQRLMEAQKKAAEQQQGNGQMDPKDAAKIQATIIGAQVKAQNQKLSHAQRMAQRQLAWEQEQRQKQQQHQADLASQHTDTLANIAKTDIETAATVRRNRMKSFSE